MENATNTKTTAGWVPFLACPLIIAAIAGAGHLAFQQVENGILPWAPYAVLFPLIALILLAHRAVSKEPIV